MTKKITRAKDFILNEPSLKINNGKKRKSILIANNAFPMRQQRDRINKLLLTHDNQTVPAYQLTEKDIPLLTQIAQEGSISNNIPALRYHAIVQLASFPSVDTFNTLSYLANYGEDHYIKSYALHALGFTNLELSIPVLTQHAQDKDLLVQQSAKNGLTNIIKSLGIGRVQSYFKVNPHLNSKILAAIIREMQQPIRKKSGQTKQGL